MLASVVHPLPASCILRCPKRWKSLDPILPTGLVTGYGVILWGFWSTLHTAPLLRSVLHLKQWSACKEITCNVWCSYCEISADWSFFGVWCHWTSRSVHFKGSQCFYSQDFAVQTWPWRWMHYSPLKHLKLFTRQHNVILEDLNVQRNVYLRYLFGGKNWTLNMRMPDVRRFEHGSWTH